MNEKPQSRPINPDLQEAREHFKSARQSMHQSLQDLLPKDFTEKHRAARREFLLGLRKLLDVAIDHEDKKQ